MAQQIKNVKNGVAVKINPYNAVRIVKICAKTLRTFATEINLAVSEYVRKHETLNNPRDNGR